MSINIITLNVRGLQDQSKRRSVFNFYRKRAKILCLQESHSDSKSEKLWRSEFGGEILYSHGETNARGVCILFSKQSGVKIIRSKHDEEGRILICEIEVDGHRCVITNIYAPNYDCPAFFMKVAEMLEDFSEAKIVLGDFNLVLDTQLDRLHSVHNNKKALEFVNTWVEESLMCDIWRLRNPETRRYSWFAKRIKAASRIDFALIDNGLADQVVNCQYLTGIHTDHSAYYMAIDFSNSTRGRGYWKLNTSHLQIPEFYEVINQQIDKDVITYRNQEIIKKWELIKFGLANAAQDFARQRASEKGLIIAQLSEKLTELEDNITGKPEAYMIDLLERTKTDLEEFQQDYIRGVMFRSGAKSLGEYEKNSAYFFALEKNRYNSKTCHTLLNNGELITNQEDVLKMQKDFYKELYEKDTDVEFNLENTI